MVKTVSGVDRLWGDKALVRWHFGTRLFDEAARIEVMQNAHPESILGCNHMLCMTPALVLHLWWSHREVRPRQRYERGTVCTLEEELSDGREEAHR
jgi:hypothetical protein